MKLPNTVSDFNANQSGATTIEYGIIVAVVSLVLIAGLGKVGDETTGVMDRVTAALQGNPEPTPVLAPALAVGEDGAQGSAATNTQSGDDLEPSDDDEE